MSNCCGVKIRINGDQITLFEELCTTKVVLNHLIKTREGELSFKVKFNSTQPFSLFKPDVQLFVKIQGENEQFNTSDKFNFRSGYRSRWSKWFTLGHLPAGSYSVSISFWEKPPFSFDYGFEASVLFPMELEAPV